ncbi:translocator protein-like protein [Senna tora]|uniref:Translocator protein-like protein n=1 Tax=Senna tora TaxID=362788 RepID=A0A834TAG4_9FABA|nr:translocator protein-like protein [Senna tora]
MASQELKHRVTAPSTTTTTAMDNKRMVMAKRGLKSLTIALSLPLSLSLLSAYVASSSNIPPESRKPFWFPPMWALHLTCPASSFLMGVSAWMMWADGGFHRYPTALILYLAHLLFTLLWDPLVFGAGATRLGFILCFAMFGTMLGCYRMFAQVNPISRDLIKPCFASAAFLSIVNLNLLFV